MLYMTEEDYYHYNGSVEINFETKDLYCGMCQERIGMGNEYYVDDTETTTIICSKDCFKSLLNLV